MLHSENDVAAIDNIDAVPFVADALQRTPENDSVIDDEKSINDDNLGSHMTGIIHGINATLWFPTLVQQMPFADLVQRDLVTTASHFVNDWVHWLRRHANVAQDSERKVTSQIYRINYAIQERIVQEDSGEKTAIKKPLYYYVFPDTSEVDTVIKDYCHCFKNRDATTTDQDLLTCLHVQLKQVSKS